MNDKAKRSYQQLMPSPDLEEFVDSYWQFQNFLDEPYQSVIIPDGYFKVVIEFCKDKVKAFFLTGLWPKETQITISPKAIVYGTRFKILAPEFILKREVGSLLQSHLELDLDYWNLHSFQFQSFEAVVSQIESILRKQLSQQKPPSGKKLQLSQLLYHTKGEILVEELANQISWSPRQISRYLNKYLGVSLKRYLNIQKCYEAYIQIREGRFFPEQGYYDQAHFIKEIKKHTNHTPKELYKGQNDRFIQLKDIEKK